jgi:hypothetical protein
MMRTFPLSLAALLLALVWSASVAQDAASVPRRAGGIPDLNGIWQAMNAAYWDLEAHGAAQGITDEFGALVAVSPGLGVVDGGAIPYRAEARAQQQANFNVRATEDIEAKCFLPGVPRATYLPHPFQIVQGDGDLLIAYQYAGAVRTIYMHDHMDAPVPSWMGWSNGHWDGDTLVVEVSGLNGQSWLDRAGNYTTDAVRVTERYTLTGPDHMLYEATIEDPNVFTQPWTIRMPLYRRVEPNAQLLEFKCVEFAEELMYGHLSKAAGEAPTNGESE